MSQAVADVRPLKADLHWLAVRLARGLGAAMEQITAEHGLSLRAHVVLNAVVERPGSSQLAIARAAGVDKSVLVGVLDALERHGYVRRTPDPADRRARLIEATPAGRDALARTTRAVREIEDQLMAGVDADDRATFMRLLREFVDGPLAAGFDLAACLPSETTSGPPRAARRR